MLSFYQIATWLSLTTCQIATSLLSQCVEPAKQCERILITSCRHSIGTTLRRLCFKLCITSLVSVKLQKRWRFVILFSETDNQGCLGIVACVAGGFKGLEFMALATKSARKNTRGQRKIREARRGRREKTRARGYLYFVLKCDTFSKLFLSCA